jgi:molecular chaperone DnaK
VTTARDGVVVGIDFGTSYSSAGALVDGNVELVLDDGDPMIPSVVYLPARGAPVVGRRAMTHAVTDPTSTIASLKRFLGLTADDDLILNLSAGVPYKLRHQHGHLVVSAGGRDYVCEQLAAEILTRIRDLAQQRFGGRITRAVVTVPATATPAYVEALRRAAKIAHLEILQVVAEPVAGALALGLHRDAVERRVVVCDFGGGTFDVTAIIQRGRRFLPIATGGDTLLGGDDLDVAMASAIAGLVYKQARFDVLKDQVRRTQLLQRCESAKRTLSSATEARLMMRDAYIEAGEYRQLNMMITRSWIEPIWQPLIDRAIGCVTRTLATAGWQPTDVDQVVLIGGGSMVPLFRASMERVIPADRISTTPLAGVAVAMGATLLTAPHIGRGADVPVLELRDLRKPDCSPSVEDDGIPIDLG